MKRRFSNLKKTVPRPLLCSRCTSAIPHRNIYHYHIWKVQLATSMDKMYSYYLFSVWFRIKDFITIILNLYTKYSKFLNKKDGNMKLISKLLLILLGCSSCDPNTHEFGFEVYNQSDREIDVCLNMWYLGIQDTLVPAYQDYDATSQYNYGFTTVEKKSVNLFIVPGSITAEEIFRMANDTIRIFIFDTDTLAKYSWEEISRNYNILQRYDLTLKDMKLLKHDIYYPPTPAMRNIKMWPPYSE